MTDAVGVFLKPQSWFAIHFEARNFKAMMTIIDNTARPLQLKNGQNASLAARPTERGVALAMSLIFLLILTLFAVVSMNTGTMQEKMAGNMRDQDIALQGAESAIRYGRETLLTTLAVDINTPCLNNANNIWCANLVDWKTASWWDANGVSYRADGTKQIAEAYEDPRMALEEIGIPESQIGCKDAQQTSYDRPKPCPRHYRLNARGRGASGISEAVLHGHMSVDTRK